jgi:WD domain, G-beta repeat.
LIDLKCCRKRSWVCKCCRHVASPESCKYDAIICSSEDEPLQRVVRIGRSGKLMATGGTDGHVRLWQFPSLKQTIDISAHSKEIDDLDISPNEKLVWHYSTSFL